MPTAQSHRASVLHRYPSSSSITLPVPLPRYIAFGVPFGQRITLSDLSRLDESPFHVTAIDRYPALLDP